jgi:hypothetical protein
MSTAAGPLGAPTPSRLTLVAVMLEDAEQVEALVDSGCGERRPGERENWFKIALTPRGVKTCRAFLGLCFHRPAASEFARSRNVDFSRALGLGRPMSEAAIRSVVRSLASLTTQYREGREREVIARTKGSQLLLSRRFGRLFPNRAWRGRSTPCRSLIVAMQVQVFG